MLRKLLVITVLLGVLGAAGMILFLAESHEGSLVAREVVTEWIEEQTGMRVTLGSVEVHALQGEVEVTDLRLDGNRAPRMAGASYARFGLATVPLLGGTVRVSTLDVAGPYLNLVVEDGKIRGLPDVKTQGGGGRVSERAFFRLFVEQFRMVDLEVRIRVEGKHPVDVQLHDVRAALTARGADVHDGVFSLGEGVVVLPTGRAARIQRLVGEATLQGEGLLRPEQLDIASARMLMDGISGDMHGTVRFAPLSTGLIPAADLMVTGFIPLSTFNGWFPDLLPMGGTVDFDAHVRSAFGGRNPVAVGSGELRGIDVAEFVIGNWAGDFVADLSGVEFTNVHSDFAGGDIRGAGRVDLGREVTARFSATGRNASFAKGMANIRVPGSWVEFGVNADVEFEGTIWPRFEFRGEGDAVLENLRVYSEFHETASPSDLVLRVDTVRGHSRMEFDMEHFSFVDGTISDGRTTVTGTVYLPLGLDRDFWVEGSADPDARPGEMFDCESISPIGPVELTCRGPGRFHIKGSYMNPRIWGDARLSDVSVQGYTLGNAVGSFDYQQLVLRFLDVKGRRVQTDWEGGATLNWRGYMGERFDGRPLGHAVTRRETLHVSVNATRVDGRAEDLRGAIPPGWGSVMEYLRSLPMHGSIRGSAQARGYVGDGTVDDLTFETEFTAGEVDIYEQRFDEGRIRAHMDLARFHFDDVKLRRGPSSWTAAGTIGRADAALDVDVAVRDMPLKQLDALSGARMELAGNFHATSKVGGNIGNWRGPVRLDVRDVRAGNIPVGNGFLDLEMVGDRIKGTGPLFDERAHLDWEMRLEPPWAFNASADVENGPAQDLLGPGVLPRGVTLTMGAHVTATGNLSEASRTRGNVTVSRATLGWKKLALTSDGAVELRYAGDRVTLERLILVDGDEGKVELRGTASASQLDLDLQMQGDLRVSRLFVDSVRDARGPLNLKVSISGTPEHPVLVGQGQLQQGHLEVDGFRHKFNDIDTPISFIRDRVVMEPLTFKLDESPVRGSAEVLLSDLSIRTITLNARFQDLRFQVPDYLPTRLTGGITMTGDGRTMLLTGDIDVMEARYTEPWDWERLSLEFRRRRLAPRVFDKDKEWLTLDVHLRADDRIFVRNNNMDAEFRGDLQLTGTNERVGLVGTLTSLGGRATYRNNLFELGRGTVDFVERNRIAVVLDVDASARVKDYDVFAEVRGPVEQLSTEQGIRLFSRPDLPAVEVLSLVVLGFTQGDINAASNTTTAAAAVGASGLDFLSRATGLDAELHRAIPRQVMDEFYLTSRTRAGGSVEMVPTVVLGTELRPGTRLRVTSSLAPSAGANSSDQSVEVEQRWTKHLSGRASWTKSPNQMSQYGDAGLDVRYRQEF